MAEFALAVFLLIITPGPGVLSTAGVGSGFGFRAGLAYVAGLFVGNLTVVALVISGLAAVALTIPWLRVALLVVSTAYLFYLAAKVAFAGTRVGFIYLEKPPGFVGGFALQPINPKAYVVNTTLFSSFPFMADNLSAEIAIKVVLLNLIWIPIHLVWLWAGASLHRLDLAPGTQRAINVVMAIAMLAVVGMAILFRPGG